MPIASLESLIGRKSYLPYLQAGAVDVAIIDTLWNGVGESVKIAALCDTFEVNCAAHNYHGWLGTAISAHFCASIPNFKVLEVDVDDVPWKDEIVTVVPRIENSTFYMPTGPVRDRMHLRSALWSHAQARSSVDGL
jgi:galactonate dehydratase